MATAFALNTPYSLVLLTEYTHTLDTLPIELSRNFADLRELDAVLSTSFQSMTAKIHNLTTMIEEGKASKADRLWLLSDIAEEAQRLKLGGEDKIRVACQAADNLKGHANHLRELSLHLPEFDQSVLDRRTVYPHVSDRSYMPVTTMETGRRRRAVLGSIMTNPDPSPAKRKRAPNKDDDIDVGTSRTPKKIAGAEGNSRSRNNARAKKSVRTFPPVSIYFLHS
jgi:inhibitor of growth protein 3